MHEREGEGKERDKDVCLQSASAVAHRGLVQQRLQGLVTVELIFRPLNTDIKAEPCKPFLLFTGKKEGHFGATENCSILAGPDRVERGRGKGRDGNFP